MYCFVCKLFGPMGSSHCAVKDGLSDCRNNIVVHSHEQSDVHRDSMLTYLARRQGLGLQQKLEKQINEEHSCWKNALRRAIADICRLGERGMRLRVTNVKFGSLQNWNYIGLLELIIRLDPCVAAHIVKYENSGKGNPSHISTAIGEELTEIMAHKDHVHIMNEVMSSCYFSESVDSTPDLSHIEPLSVVLRCVVDGVH